MSTKCLTDGKKLVIWESKEQETDLKKFGFIVCKIDLTKADVQQDIIDAYEKGSKKTDPEYATKVMTPKKKVTERKKAASK